MLLEDTDSFGLPIQEECIASKLQSIGEDVDSFGVPEVWEAKPPRPMYYLIVPTTDTESVLKNGFKSIHGMEWFYLSKEDALSHAEYESQHMQHPVSLLGVDASVEIHKAKNALYWRNDKKKNMVQVRSIPANKITHLKDIGKPAPKRGYKKLGNFQDMLKKGAVKDSVDEMGSLMLPDRQKNYTKLQGH